MGEDSTITKAYTSSRRDGQDKRLTLLIRWVFGVLGAAATAALYWGTAHLLGAERTNEVQDTRIKVIEDRTTEDRAAIRDLIRELGQKIDRVIERVR